MSIAEAALSKGFVTLAIMVLLSAGAFAQSSEHIGHDPNLSLIHI